MIDFGEVICYVLTMKYEFNTLSINSDIDSFVSDYTIDSEVHEPTAFNPNFLPQCLRPNLDLFHQNVNLEMTVIWFSMLKHWSSYDNPELTDSTSSHQRVWNFSNELMFKSFLQKFVREGEKVQIKGDSGIRINLSRKKENADYESLWKDRIGDDKELTSDDYFLKLLKKIGIKDKIKRRALHLLYERIKCGFADSYEILPCRNLKEASGEMSINRDQFIKIFIKHLDKHPGMYDLSNEKKPTSFPCWFLFIR